MLGSNIRRFAAKRLTRGHIETYADEVQLALFAKSSSSNPRNDQPEILGHAASNVPYYRNYANSKLGDFPVIGKNDMRANMGAFLSSKKDLGELSSASTSGSTGIPFTAYFDRGKVLRHRAGLVGSYRFMEADPYGSFVFSRAWAGLGLKQRLILAAKDHLPFAGVHQDSKSITDIVKWMNRRKNVTLMGYSSYIEALLHSVERLKLTIRPDAIGAVVGGSEPASSNFGANSVRVFHTKPRMRYSSIELGVIAVTGQDLDFYHIDTSSFVVEILREDNDTSAAPGEVGRIVVTDLYNQAMPFIRYDTGDLGQFYVDENGVENQAVLTGIKGRRLDTIIGGTSRNPRKLHSLQIWGPTSKISGIRQFQLRQHSIGKFTWVLNASRSVGLEERLRNILTDVVGPVEECKFVYVDEVPVMASGKRQFFVSEISPE